MSTDRERRPSDDELPSGAEMLDPRRGESVKRSHRTVKVTKEHGVADESEHERAWPRGFMEPLTRDLVIIAMLALILLVQVFHTLLLWKPSEQNDVAPVATVEASDGQHEGTKHDDLVGQQTIDDVGAADGT